VAVKPVDLNPGHYSGYSRYQFGSFDKDNLDITMNIEGKKIGVHLPLSDFTF